MDPNELASFGEQVCQLAIIARRVCPAFSLWQTGGPRAASRRQVGDPIAGDVATF
ncbi:hypothetical protein SH139x_002426 [Planctomycetaceae bacterium SH139]